MSMVEIVIKGKTHQVHRPLYVEWCNLYVMVGLLEEGRGNS